MNGVSRLLRTLTKYLGQKDILVRRVVPFTVLLLVAVLGLHFLRESHAATPCSVSDKLVNSCRPWVGAWSKDYPQVAPGVKNQALYHEQRIGRQLDLIKDYKVAGGQLSADDKYFINRSNTYLLLTWKPAGSFGAGDGSAAYASIDTMARSIKAVAPKKIFLSIWHEPENDISAGTTSCRNAKGNAGSPAQYVAMWQNVHNRFAADGVSNVVWTYIPMGYSGWDCMEKQMWPGNNLVDWIMWDPYANGDNDSWSKTVSPFYNWLTANTDSTHAYTSKPWGLAETSIHLNHNESSGVSFWQGAKQALDAGIFSRLKAYVVFDSTNGKPDNRVGYWCKAWTGEKCNAGQDVADPAKAAAYKAFADDPRFTDAYYATGSPIPTPLPTPTPTRQPTPTPTQQPTPTPTPPQTGNGDANNDHHVNSADVSIYIAHYGTDYPPADFNHDHTVNGADLHILLTHWTW